jgi:hypothetical protein
MALDGTTAMPTRARTKLIIVTVATWRSVSPADHQLVSLPHESRTRRTSTVPPHNQRENDVGYHITTVDAGDTRRCTCLLDQRSECGQARPRDHVSHDATMQGHTPHSFTVLIFR